MDRRQIRSSLTARGRLGLLEYVAHRPVDPDRVPKGNRFRSVDDLVADLAAAGFVVVDRVDGAALPDAPLDWRLRQERLHDELEAEHGDDDRWRQSKRQEEAFARLLDDGVVGSQLLLCI